MSLAGLQDGGLASPKSMRMPGFVGFSAPPFAVNNDQVKEFEEKFQQAKFRKGLILKKVGAKIFDLSQPAEMSEYLTLRQDLFNGNQAGTHLEVFFDRRFVPEKGTWMAFVEWAEIALEAIENSPMEGRGHE